MVKKLLVCGEGRAGKDTACEYLARVTGLRNAGTTSLYLAGYVATHLGISAEEAYARRHESDEVRSLWYHIGNRVRMDGPTTLVRKALENGEITGGVRDLEEVLAVRREGLVDLIVWVANDRVKKDPTVMFSEKECDIVVPNHWGLGEFHGRLDRLVRFAGLAKGDPCE